MFAPRKRIVCYINYFSIEFYCLNCLKIISVILILIAILFSSLLTDLSNAWARDLADEEKLVSIPIIHTLQTNAVANLSDIVYTIDFEPQAPLGDGYYAVPNKVAAAISSSPIMFQLSGAEADSPSSATEWTRIYSKTKTLEEIFGVASNFGNAGIYTFKVTENVEGGTSKATTNGSNTWNNSAEAYIMRVYVKNNEMSELAYDFATVSKLNNNAEAADNMSKTSELAFSSKYAANQTLNLSKIVSGAFGDKSHAFPFEITLYLPDWTTGTIISNVTTTATLAEGQDDFSIVSAGSNEPVGAKKVVYLASIADGDSVNFIVPVGTRYRVFEQDTTVAGVVYTAAAEYSADFSLPQTEIALPPVAESGTGNRSIFTYERDDSSSEHSQIITVGNGGDISLQDLVNVSASLASGNTTYQTRINDYIAEDISFVFVDDPQGDRTSNALFNNGSMEYRIIGVNHDMTAGDNSQPAGLTFMAKNALNKGYYINPTDANSNGWKGSILRKELNPWIMEEGSYSSTASIQPNGELYALLPPSVKGAAKEIIKHSNSGLAQGGNNIDIQTADKFWILSLAEFCGSNQYDPFSNVNSRYEGFYSSGNSNPNLVDPSKTITQSAVVSGAPSEATGSYSYSMGGCWLRSAHYSSNSMFIYRHSAGNSYDHCPTGYIKGIQPCFSL